MQHSEALAPPQHVPGTAHSETAYGEAGTPGAVGGSSIHAATPADMVMTNLPQGPSAASVGYSHPHLHHSAASVHPSPCSASGYNGPELQQTPNHVAYMQQRPLQSPTPNQQPWLPVPEIQNYACDWGPEYLPLSEPQIHTEYHHDFHPRPTASLSAPDRETILHWMATMPRSGPLWRCTGQAKYTLDSTGAITGVQCHGPQKGSINY